MKTLFQTVAVAFSMFSAVPMPQFPWDAKNMRYALCAFPLIGVLIGGLGWLWWLACGWLGFPALVRGAGLCLLPLWVTGGIHLDGYCDTHDALASHAGPEKRQEILKDPHIGAFGVMRLCGYLLVSFVLWATLPDYAGVPIWLSFVLSRCRLRGMGMALAALGIFVHYRRKSEREFGGLSGDLAGWFLQRAELGMLAALWLVEWLEGIV